MFLRHCEWQATYIIVYIVCDKLCFQTYQISGILFSISQKFGFRNLSTHKPQEYEGLKIFCPSLLVPVRHAASEGNFRPYFIVYTQYCISSQS